MGCCWSGTRSEVEVPQARRRYENRGTLNTLRVPATYVPSTYVPATHVPATHVPATHVPATHVPVTHFPATHVPATHVPATHVPANYVPATRVPSTYATATRVPARVSSPAVPTLRVPVPIFNNVAESPKHCYGEYKCVCGRFWNSTLSWPELPQGCQKCERNVYPHTQRELRPEDFKEDEVTKHMTELCPKCKELGRHCGYLRKPTKKRNNHSQYDSYSNTRRKRLGYQWRNSNRKVTRYPSFKSMKSRY